jgi:hypothetical protein
MLLGGQVEPWDVDWAHEQAVKALEWLARNYPECSGSEGLREHDKAANEAAMRAGPGRLPRGPQKLLQGRQGRGASDKKGSGMTHLVIWLLRGSSLSTRSKPRS